MHKRAKRGCAFLLISAIAGAFATEGAAQATKPRPAGAGATKPSAAASRPATRRGNAPAAKPVAADADYAARGNTAARTNPLTPEEIAKVRAQFRQVIGAKWIWSPAFTKDQVPVGTCYFRKVIEVQKSQFAQVHIACDNQYELFVNGKPAGNGGDWRKMNVHNITALLVPGRNVVAIKAVNLDEGAAGLVARMLVQEPGTTMQSYSTDQTWRTSVNEFAGWDRPTFNDRDWLPAAVYGELGATLPWGDEVVIAGEGSRFTIEPEFVVERVARDEQTGSLIAMTFNSAGEMLVSEEGGGIKLVRDADGDGTYEVTTYSDAINTAQGLVTVGARVFAVGSGPQGPALYRLTDTNRDGTADEVVPIVKFIGSPGEHGPHAVELGPDGLLYLMIGNFARIDAPANPQSPYKVVYEGDLNQPRYEDPRGHAVGVPAPGATIVRTDINGSRVELFAGGFRNPYDLAFDPQGELFTYDADMEWDIGAPWYRPTRINHVPAGAELGWRSGWAKWPEYFLDSLPATLNIGPGSPTGVTFYRHTAFPERLQNTLFAADWARGEIHAVRLERSGASYKATSSVFLRGRPLNVTDLTVGPEGALYFCTGGRGTDGGIYRVKFTGQVPAKPQAAGIDVALRQPQADSDWARAEIARAKRDVGEEWQTLLPEAASDARRPIAERLRALDLMAIYGPMPDAALLLKLSQDPSSEIRAAAARRMARGGDAQFDARLADLLDDKEPWVRRVACESIAYRRGEAPIAKLVELLNDDDRFMAFAARRALESQPTASWATSVLEAQQPRVFMQGAIGLLAVEPTPQNLQAVLARSGQMLQENRSRKASLAEREQLDLLRVVQVALHRGAVPPEQAAEIRQQLVQEYPSASALRNRELVRLLVHLQAPEAAKLMVAELAKDIPETEKLHIAAYAPRLRTGWTTPEKLALLRFYEDARAIEGGYSVSAYIENFARDYFTLLSLPERRQVLAAGEFYPAAALSVLATLPPQTGAELLAEIRALDGKLEGKIGEDRFARLRVGITAVLAGSGDAEALAYLRDVYKNTPERRATIAMAFTQNPGGENWALLVESLPILDGVPAQDVLAALATVDQRPQAAEPFRQVILQGLLMPAGAKPLATALLAHWSGAKPAAATAPIAEQLAAWQAWYAQQFPKALPATLPTATVQNRWSYDELASFLNSSEGKAGDATRGAVVFREAKCADCHRVGNQGEGIGPDLSTVARRFQTKEILESIVYPSQVISDQYASMAVTANGKTYVGLAVRDGEHAVVLTAEGEKVRLAMSSVEQVEPVKTSSMPEGLLNPLRLDQVADLFAFLLAEPTPAVATQPQQRR
ncbi:MAG: HEAT repeat domain-containing protein [Pirellulales bacterium]